MRPVPLAILGLVLALTPAACRTAPSPELAPLPERGSVPIEYRVLVGPAGTKSLVPKPGPATPGSASEAKVHPRGPAIELGCEILRVDAATARHLAGGEPHDARARRTDLGAVRELLETLAQHTEYSLVTAPSLLLHEGQPGDVTVIGQTAYVARFDGEVRDGVAFADPGVEVVDDGMRLRMRAARAGDGVSLELELVLAELQRPIRDHAVPFPGSSEPVRIQLPLTSVQTLITEGRIGADECLVLTAFDAVNLDQRLLAILTARQIQPGDLEGMPRETR